MTSAAYHDARSREVPDIHWLLVSVMSAVMCVFRLDGIIHVVLGMASVAMMAVYMLSDRVSGLLAIPFLAFPVLIHSFLYIDGEGPWVLVVPVMYLFFLTLYHLGMLRGGADAKAMMSLSMVSPYYPWSGAIWTSGALDGILLNPPFVVFALALVLSLLSAVPVLIGNLRSGRLSPFHYRISIEEAEHSFVWPLEDVVDGRVRRVGPPEDPGDVYERLRGNGNTDVEVTPMVPFIVPITVSYVMVMIIGDPLTAVIG
ncbi:MAG: hypothetical protein ACI38Y_01170 [Candidatus Methanomethylophilaceae archaeon]